MIDILDVSILPRRWPMRNGLIYVCIIYTSKLVVAFRTYEASEKWIDKLNDGISYANYIDKKICSFLLQKELEHM